MQQSYHGYYLATLPSGSVPDILDWWRDNAARFPVLSKIARDFLAVPASGVGVENLFSTARDICHYRRNRLAPETIEAIMIQISNDRFEMKRDYELSDDNDTDGQQGVLQYKEDLEAEFTEPEYISAVEDQGGLEDDDSDWGSDNDEADNTDNNEQTPSLSVQTQQPEVVIPQSNPSTRSSTTRPRRVVHKPGHFNRLEKGL